MYFCTRGGVRHRFVVTSVVDSPRKSPKPVHKTSCHNSPEDLELDPNAKFETTKY